MKKGKPTFRIIGDTGVVKTQKQVEDEERKIVEAIRIIFEIVDENKNEKIANGA